MEFKLKNFGKIAEADIKLDGITVICGDNDTGKSTVGKALFAFFNSLYDLNNTIASIKTSQIRNFLFSYAFSLNKHNGYSFSSDEDLEQFRFDGKISVDELKNYIDKHIEFPTGEKVTKDRLIPLVDDLNVPVSDTINELIFRTFDNVMNGQIKNENSIKHKCTLEASFNVRINEKVIQSKEKNVISFTKVACKYDKLSVPIRHKAYYINSPFVLDWLNNSERMRVLRAMNLMDRSTVSAIIQAQADINADPKTNILDSVRNKNELEYVRKIIKKAYTGDTKISNGKYFYTDENGKDFDFRNISAGLKSFALIERMLETGVLKKKDVLILDEPEIHLHSEWQIIYAELIVMLQKQFDLTILIVTHSFQFLESLDFFMKTSEKNVKRNYYIPERTDKGVVMKSYGNISDELKQNLVKGSINLANMEFKYEMEQDKNGTQDD